MTKNSIKYAKLLGWGYVDTVSKSKIWHPNFGNLALKVWKNLATLSRAALYCTCTINMATDSLKSFLLLLVHFCFLPPFSLFLHFLPP